MIRKVCCAEEKLSNENLPKEKWLKRRKLLKESELELKRGIRSEKHISIAVKLKKLQTISDFGVDVNIWARPSFWQDYRISYY